MAKIVAIKSRSIHLEPNSTHTESCASTNEPSFLHPHYMMCPPSSTRNHQRRSVRVSSIRSGGFFFDTNRRGLHQNHKFATADLSQVCDGRNWESFRHATESSKRKQGRASRKTASVADVRDKMNTVLGAADKYCADKMKSNIIESYNPKSTRTPVPCISDCFVEQEKKQGIKNTQRASLESIKEVSSDDTGKAAARERSNPQDQGRPSVQPTFNSTSSNRRHSSSSRPRQQHSDEGNKDRRRNSSSSRSRRQDSDEGNKDRRRSSSARHGRRRHSHEEKVPPTGLPKRGNPSRRRSLDSNTSTPPVGLSRDGSLMAIRKLSEPMHRCNTTNQNVSGIMRRARYSSNNLAAMATEGAPPSPLQREKTLQGSASTIRRNVSSLDLSCNTNAGLSSEGLSLPRSASSVDVRLSGSKMMRNNDSMMKEGMDSDDWVASGVEFSKSMEVYLFKT